jgi:hypothetical protein
MAYQVRNLADGNVRHTISIKLAGKFYHVISAWLQQNRRYEA